MTFVRAFNGIAELGAVVLFRDKLLPEVAKGEVFPAIRDGNICFYYKGGRLFLYDGEFHTHKKYALAPDDSQKNYLTEIEFREAVRSLKLDFVSNYNGIKRNCALYSRASEAEMVASLYGASFACKGTTDADVVLLDIEIALSGQEDSEMNRIDILLYSKKERNLQFVEAKLYTNPEIRSTTTPKIVGQMMRYEGELQKRGEKEILPAYKAYVRLMNELLMLNMPEPLTVSKKVGLLIADYDGQQEKDVRKICGNLMTHFPVYSIGRLTSRNAQTLYRKVNDCAD